MKTALIAGYTGLVGQEVLKILLSSKKYSRVIALGRRKIDLTHPKLEQQIVDFNSLQIAEKIDVVFCCLGTTIKQAGSKENFRLVDFQFPLNLALTAKQQGADAFLIITAMGAKKSSMFFYNRVKGEVEEALEHLEFNKLEVLRPSLLLGKRQDSRILESLSIYFMKLLGFLFIGPLKNFKGIHAAAVARAMVYFANDGSAGRRIHYSGVLQRFC